MKLKRILVATDSLFAADLAVRRSERVLAAIDLYATDQRTECERKLHGSGKCSPVLKF